MGGDDKSAILLSAWEKTISLLKRSLEPSRPSSGAVSFSASPGAGDRLAGGEGGKSRRRAALEKKWLFLF